MTRKGLLRSRTKQPTNLKESSKREYGAIQKKIAAFYLFIQFCFLGKSERDHHHHHVVPLARISLTLSRHYSLSFIASERSSGLHPVSSHSCCTYVRAGRPAFARLYVGVHMSTSLMSSSLFLQQCPACLVRLTWIVYVVGDRWTYSWCSWRYHPHKPR